MSGVSCRSELPHICPLAHLASPANTHRCGRHYVRVCSVYVGVWVVAKNVLIDPGIHGGTIEEVVDNPAHYLPHPGLVSDSKVTGGEEPVDHMGTIAKVSD